ncbi:hypothetical protein L202_00604 [Cryptococcus amylolentus CBS 6039]|uniref:Zinc finger C2HC5-type domain-containing protein n=1 Tax=Cryptococcus amylolentus CBS 6039 TaxID=1295533 RepID=A0A1E3I7M9_9TREE|nr:hypothetical protein L202_00604 [Cryptococcus amylolentus CBS 6039]ODN84713.1 hypothetical protein L202_00604 [Cryptococcus amylolentus CBS 6039]
MAPQRPPWIVNDMTKILGLDEETVAQMIMPQLEEVASEARLRAHLQSFLGPTQAARDFTTRYLALRFPSISNTASALPNTKLAPDSDIAKSKANVKSPVPGSSSGAGSSRAIQDAFGPGGKVYMKNRDADEASFLSRGVSGSQGGIFRSGSSTPVPRQAGAVHYNVVDKGKGSAGGAKGKGKAAEKIWDLPKSREVKKIESIIEALKKIKDDGPQPGDGHNCFCQARIHPLSKYTPICPNCALIVCSLHAPQLPCPSCAKPLYSSAQLTRLLLTVENDLDEQLLKEKGEEEERERKRQEVLMAESGGGNFPTLPVGLTGTNNVPLGNSRKVISIGAKEKGKGRATVTTTTYRSGASSTAPLPRSKTPPPQNILPRPRSLPTDQNKAASEIAKITKWRKEEGRPWGDLKAEKKGLALKYKEVDRVALRLVDENAVGRRKKGKMKGEGEGGRVVPGAQKKA